VPIVIIGGTDMNKGWGVIALVIAGLYWLQAVLIPLALAILLTFLLSPVVGILQRRGLGRVPAVLVTVLLALSVLGGIGWTLTRQLVTLANELPRYTLNIHHRSRRDDGARYATNAGPAGAYARAPRSGFATDAGSRGRAMDRPDHVHGARAYPRRVTGIVNHLPRDLNFAREGDTR
jgi:hypothetical protein